jgi:hypothetical protein
MYETAMLMGLVPNYVWLFVCWHFCCIVMKTLDVQASVKYQRNLCSVPTLATSVLAERTSSLSSNGRKAVPEVDTKSRGRLQVNEGAEPRSFLKATHRIEL